ncbi:ribonuclease III family protein [Riemerella columbina]|uniref:ribonuclease III family protein n=1 Tax=Riemerella columbina TaxID=103810 RepID=UPI00039A06A3|nr:ribonuclease III domain-containing protein [Riemerella columbina]
MRLKGYLQKILSVKRRHASKKTFTSRELLLNQHLNQILGTQPKHIHWYDEAFSLKSPICAKNYDRLEFLGDAVLGSIVSYYLYQQYPNDNEGFLTQMKSKIVNRKNLNQIGNRLRLTELVKVRKGIKFGEDLSGNLLEALIGAIYMDLGYEMCQTIVLNRLLPKSEIAKLEHKIISYKSLMLEWGQKHKLNIEYQTQEEQLPNQQKVFKSCIFIKGKKIASASETSKKKAEEKVAQRAFYSLNKKEKIIEKHKINT